MVLVEIAQEDPGFVFYPDRSVLLEASGVIEALSGEQGTPASLAMLRQMDTRPIHSDVHIEVAGPALAAALEMPVLQPGYPKAAIRVQRLHGEFTAARAFAGFQNHIREALNDHEDGNLYFPTPPHGVTFAGLALMIITVKYTSAEYFIGFSQVHYNRNGIAQPYDLDVVIDEGTDYIGNPLEPIGGLKNLALALFGHQRIEPYSSATRQVHINTVDGSLPLDFHYLQPMTP